MRIESLRLRCVDGSLLRQSGRESRTLSMSTLWFNMVVLSQPSVGLVCRVLRVLVSIGFVGGRAKRKQRRSGPVCTATMSVRAIMGERYRIFTCGLASCWVKMDYELHWVWVTKLWVKLGHTRIYLDFVR
jgi:hypothetical protein